ncbi:MAG: hypothetical protein IID44_06575 [Planctomycetes bacterium]|nr:hypothetical protein [Planctomycetota bacterium]
MKLQRTWVLLVGVLLVAASASARKWTDNTGKFSVEAELVEAKDGNVRLKRKDGKIMTVPVSRLSKADRDYLAFIAEAKKKSEAAKPTREEVIAAIRNSGGHVEDYRNKEELMVRCVGYLGTDAGLKHLDRLPTLVRLDLDGTKVTDAGLKHMKGLESLERLRLNNTNVSGAGLEHFGRLTKLRYLNLSDTKTDDAGLEHLKGLSRLEFLGLDNTNITGAGLAHLKGMTRLEWLHVQSTKVTDAGLEHLKGRHKRMR